MRAPGYTAAVGDVTVDAPCQPLLGRRPLQRRAGGAAVELEAVTVSRAGSMTRRELGRLRAKYVEMASLRRMGEESPRARLSHLAAEFPGALRELDDLTLAEIDRRIAALARAESDGEPTEPWMVVMSRFHT